MSKIYVLPLWEKEIPENSIVVNTTTKSNDWSRYLSRFSLAEQT
jgi:hypothetical protein